MKNKKLSIKKMTISSLSPKENMEVKGGFITNTMDTDFMQFICAPLETNNGDACITYKNGYTCR